jgi:hypothetical protein
MQSRITRYASQILSHGYLTFWIDIYTAKHLQEHPEDRQDNKGDSTRQQKRLTGQQKDRQDNREDRQDSNEGIEETPETSL